MGDRTLSTAEQEKYKRVLHLLREKNAAALDIDKDREFFTAALKFLEERADCIWCRYPQLCGDLLRLFSFEESEPLSWFRSQTMKCLTSCRSCIEIYYGIRPKLWATFRKVYHDRTVVDFQNTIDAFDVQRLIEPFQCYIEDRATGWKQIGLKFGLFEVFLFPGWIEDQSFGPVFESALVSLIKDKRMIRISERLPGIIVCALHPKREIRVWAREILQADSEVPQDSYQRVNYSWDTLVRLGGKISSESEYLRGLRICLAKSDAEFIRSCSNYNWLSRVLSSVAVRDEASVDAFLCLCEIYRRLDMQTLSGIPSLLESTESILSNPLIFKNEESIGELKMWVEMVVKVHSQGAQKIPFKNGHRLIGLILDFATDSLVDFDKICLVVCEFIRVLMNRLDHPYLWNKLTHLLFFLADHKFSAVRSSKETKELVESGKLALTRLLIADFNSTTKAHIEVMDSLTMSKAATFDPAVYTKYCLFLGNHDFNLDRGFISEIASVFDQCKLEDFVDGFWAKRHVFVLFFMNILADVKNLISIDTRTVQSIFFIYLMLDQIEFRGIEVLLNRILHSVPDTFIVTLSTALERLIQCNFAVAGKMIPLARTLYVVRDLMIASFKKENLLKLDPSAPLVVYTFVKSSIGSLFARWDSLLSASSAYYDFGGLLCHAALILLDSFQVSFAVKDTLFWAETLTATIKLLLRRGRDLLKRLEASQELFETIEKILGLCGRLDWTQTQISELNNVLNVLLTSGVIVVHQKILINGVDSFNTTSKYKLSLPIVTISDPIIVAPIKQLPVNVLRNRHVSDNIEESVLARHALQEASTAASNIKPTSKLGQLRQELVKEATFVKKTRIMAGRDCIPVKAPRMMSRQDLERPQNFSTDDSDPEDQSHDIHSDMFNNGPRTSTLNSVNSSSLMHTGRTVKVISLEAANDGPSVPSTGKPLQSFRQSREQRDLLSLQCLQKYVLSLDYQSLDEHNFVDASIKIGSAIPSTFSSFDSYRSTFEPLLQLEYRAQLTQAVEENQGRAQWVKGNVVSVSFVDDWHEILFNFGNDQTHGIFTDLDVIVAHPILNNQPTPDKALHVLGIVTQTSTRAQGFKVTVRFALKARNPELQLAARDKIAWKAAKLCNMVTSNREYQAMLSLQVKTLVSENVFCPRWLNPMPDSAKMAIIRRLTEQYTQHYNVNVPQAEAIAYALTDTDNFFTLIQGPPGTGKTRTIEGFLAAYFSGASVSLGVTRVIAPIGNSKGGSASRKRVLLCAPSNAAIDEILRRLTRANAFRIVRIGAPEMIHEDVKHWTLDALVDKKIANEADGVIREEEKRPGSDVAGKEQARRTKKATEDLKQALRLKILNDAQIVCCTLSASGHDILGRVDGDFEMVVIDEACQAVELSALIPLQYGAKRCILIGDPNQLPPTVISNAAVAAAYEQSLFQRLQKASPNSVRLLSVQYRMHPEISAFPSKHFYDSCLQDGPCMAEETRRPWHTGVSGRLGPYRFFDVPVGEESLREYRDGRQGHSMMNQAEAMIAVDLVVALSQSCPDFNVSGGFA